MLIYRETICCMCLDSDLVQNQTIVLVCSLHAGPPRVDLWACHLLTQNKGSSSTRGCGAAVKQVPLYKYSAVVWTRLSEVRSLFLLSAQVLPQRAAHRAGEEGGAGRSLPERECPPLHLQSPLVLTQSVWGAGCRTAAPHALFLKSHLARGAWASLCIGLVPEPRRAWISPLHFRWPSLGAQLNHLKWTLLLAPLLRVTSCRLCGSGPRM